MKGRVMFRWYRHWRSMGCTMRESFDYARLAKRLGDC